MNIGNLSTIIICITIGIITGSALTRFTAERSDDYFLPVRQDTGEYTYINPLVECEASRGMPTPELSHIEDDTRDKIEEIKRDAGLTSVAVYFRDLRNGPWIGIDEDKDFAPASLIKVPIFMTLLKMSERDSALLDKRLIIVFEGEQQIIQNIKPQEFAKSGEEYYTFRQYRHDGTAGPFN
jgi:beta-lactamase class A